MGSVVPDTMTQNTTQKKEYNINRPTPFTGDRTKIENFVQECDVYWKEQFIQSITNNQLMTFPTFLDFMMKLHYDMLEPTTKEEGHLWRHCPEDHQRLVYKGHTI